MHHCIFIETTTKMWAYSRCLVNKQPKLRAVISKELLNTFSVFVDTTIETIQDLFDLTVVMFKTKCVCVVMLNQLSIYFYTFSCHNIHLLPATYYHYCLDQYDLYIQLLQHLDGSLSQISLSYESSLFAQSNKQAGKNQVYLVFIKDTPNRS